jgi:uncharacterized protein (DUF2249 family)/hemerythrin-like domain-containing protein
MTKVFAAEMFDLQSIPSGERVTSFLAAFDRLAAGETLTVRARDSAADLLANLQAERRGGFEWSLLCAGPPEWTIEVARRTAGTGSVRGVNEALSWDHDRLDALEAAAFRQRSEGDFESALETYAAFAAGLRRHIGFEEEILFPAFEESSGMPSDAGPTAVMRAEHREIESLISEIEAGIGTASSPVDALRRRLHAVLGDHNLKEEGILYPTTDELLGADQADRLVERIQRF